MNNLQVGQVVAFCYSGSHGTRRIRNATVTQVKKTFIEIDDGSRYSAVDFRQTSDCRGEKGLRSYYLDPQVSYWDSKDDRDSEIQILNRLFESMTIASKSRNWDQVKTCFANLSDFIGE